MPEITFREYVDYRLNAVCGEVKKLHDAVDSLNTTRSELAGKANQSSVWLAYLMSLAGLLLGIIGLLRG